MRFIADSMLGRLARWLRLLGHDTLYYPHIEDSLLLRFAREEGRILLTRDTRLVKVRGLNNFLLLSENVPLEQLKKVIKTFGLIPSVTSLESYMASLISRCSLCNTVLINIPKSEAQNSVPEYVYRTSDNFKKCATCNKFYWKGTHQEKLHGKLREIL
jgi:uncharacterized protein with PIN domain